MTVTLTPAQQLWLQTQVAAGEFPTVEAGARAIIDERMAVELDGFDWAKPLLDTARAAVGRGHFVEFSDVQSRLAKRIARLGGT